MPAVFAVRSCPDLSWRNHRPGEFSFPNLPLGDHTVTVSQSGFEVLTIRNVHVSAGAIYNLPVKLRIAQTSSTVEVSAAAVAVETTTDAQTTAVAQKTVQDLPLSGRNFTQLVGFAPGFAGFGGGGAVNGSRSGQLKQQIEGVDNNDDINNSSAANQGGIQSIPGVIKPLDALEEFSVQSQSRPEVGRDAGATVNLIIKSSTNQPRWQRPLLQPQRLLRRRLTLLRAGSKASEFLNQHYGFSFGGAIIKDKTYSRAISFTTSPAANRDQSGSLTAGRPTAISSCEPAACGHQSRLR